jgi:hypothetical protein
MPDLSMPLSNNFTLGELVRSDTAERNKKLKEEQENPPDSIVENLKYLAQTALQPLRDKLGFPIRITSGYRSPGVNRKVGGSSKSQHCQGEAADCKLSPDFLTAPETAAIRGEIESQLQAITGKPVRQGINENFYLFAYVCLHIEELDIDQVIHEYGDGFGNPSWVHISASRRQSNRGILCIGHYTNKSYLKPSVKNALEYGT